MTYRKPTIVLIGLNEKMITLLTTYLSDKYHFLAIHNQFSLKKLKNYKKIQLFIMDVDQVYVKIDEVIGKLKEHEKYKVVPKIGLSLKKHHKTMDPEIRNKFDDFILMPCGNEDLLTRIDVWIKTYQNVIKPLELEPKTFSVDTTTSESESARIH